MPRRVGLTSLAALSAAALAAAASSAFFFSAAAFSSAAYRVVRGPAVSPVTLDTIARQVDDSADRSFSPLLLFQGQADRS